MSFEVEDQIVQTFLQKDIETVQEKISDVPENERIALDEDTIYRFSCSVNVAILNIKLSEIGAFAPYIYEAELTLEDIQNNYKMFKSCDNLEEVKKHIDKLFNDKKFKLQKEDNDMKLIIRTNMISEVVIINMKARRIMTAKKDDALMKLYKIQKSENKVMKKLGEYFKSLGPNGNKIVTKFNELKNLYQ